MYPRIVINTEKYRKNLRYLLDECHNRGVSVMAVSKVFCADQKLIDVMNEEKVDYIADSRIQNLETINTTIPKVLLRIPSHGEIKKVVEICEISLNSELSTVELLNQEAASKNKKHGVIIMIDLGDLREGIFDENEVINTIHSIHNMSNIDLKGIGTNLTCYGGVIPTEDNLQKLIDLKVKIESLFDVNLEIISGGNSSSIDLLLNNKLPSGINNLRLGESTVLGRETAYGDYIENTYNDVFTLEADIVELKRKPSVPIGQIGMNAFGEIPTFIDKGEQLRAIIAIGKQDVNHTDLIPFDTIKPIGSSSDHIILDVSNSYNHYQVGDVIPFKLTYGSILSLMTSKYVKKVYEDEI